MAVTWAPPVRHEKMDTYALPSSGGRVGGLLCRHGPDSFRAAVGQLHPIFRAAHQRGEADGCRTGEVPRQGEAHGTPGRPRHRRDAEPRPRAQDFAGASGAARPDERPDGCQTDCAASPAYTQTAAFFRGTGRHPDGCARVCAELQQEPARLHLHAGDAAVCGAHARHQVGWQRLQ